MTHKKWFFLFFALFFALPMFRFAGPWLFFALPLFFWFFVVPRHRGSERGQWGCGWDSEPPHKPKNDEKPKRRYVETYDGDVLEVVDDPRSV